MSSEGRPDNQLKFKIGDRVRIVGGFVFSQYLGGIPTEAVVHSRIKWPYFPSHGDWGVLVGCGGGFMVSEDEIELVEELP